MREANEIDWKRLGYVISALLLGYSLGGNMELFNQEVWKHNLRPIYQATFLIGMALNFYLSAKDRKEKRKLLLNERSRMNSAG